jgi:hypothetical protein
MSPEDQRAEFLDGIYREPLAAAISRAFLSAQTTIRRQVGGKTLCAQKRFYVLGL